MSHTLLKTLVVGSFVTSISCFASSSRLVVSVEVPDVAANQFTLHSAAVQEHCIALSHSESWCVPVLVDNTMSSVQRYSALSRGGKTRLRSATVNIPTSLDTEYAISLLQQTGLYRYVEQDVVVSTLSLPWNNTTPNDPLFGVQRYFADNSEQNSSASSVLSLWKKIRNPHNKIDVYVMDGGFRLHKDIEYAPGVNFTVVSYDNERKPGFLEHEFNEECKSAHGVGVAGIIAASINNAEGISGVVGDVTIHPLRVLNCHMGFLSDVTAALDWMTDGNKWLKQQSPDLPDFTGKPGIINLSLGGKSQSGKCPAYLQNAIDRAVEKGFVIVAAAGNEAEDVATTAPASCNGVIAVGAVSHSENQHVDLTGFSNYGPRIDVVASGASLNGLGRENNYLSWSGTSFSSPLVAGILAAVNKDFDFTPAQWKSLISISGDNVFLRNSRCAELGCGSGVMNGSKLYDNAVRMQNGTLNKANFTLNALSPCRQSWAINKLDPALKPCEQVTIAMDEFSFLAEREVIRLYASPRGQIIDKQDPSMLEWLGEFSQSNFKVSLNAVKGKDLYGQKCHLDTGDCMALTLINTMPLQTLPAACNN